MMIGIFFTVSTNRRTVSITGRCIVFSMFPCPLSSLPPIQEAFRALPLPSSLPLFLLAFLSCSSVSILCCALLSFLFPLLHSSVVSFPCFAFLLFFLSSKAQNKETKQGNETSERKQAKGNKRIEQEEAKRNEITG